MASKRKSRTAPSGLREAMTANDLLQLHLDRERIAQVRARRERATARLRRDVRASEVLVRIVVVLAVCAVIVWVGGM